jgi:Protein of unknown function (DUF2752)
VRPSAPDSRALSRPERQWRAAVTLGWPLALVSAPVLLSLNNVTLCAFRRLSGQPCPLCGGTHACAALVEGDFPAAWQANPGLMPLLVLALVHTAQLAYEAWTGRAVMPPWRIGSRLWAAAGVMLLALWITRLGGWI